MDIVNAGKETAIIRLGSEFNDTCETELSTLLEDSIKKSVRWLALDFTGVLHFDNTAINTLVKLCVRGNKARVKLVAVGLSKKQRQIFMATGLDRSYHIDRKSTAISVGAIQQAVENGRPAGPLLKNDDNWALPLEHLLVPQMPSEAINLNVNGRRTSGPQQGFGQLWEKTYRIDLTDSGLATAQIIDTVKKHFTLLQPEENRFYPSVNGIKPGEIVLINAKTPGGLVATGVRVLYAGDTTFTFITPQGHPEAGWVTFKAFEENSRTIMQIRGLARASDPIYELAFRLAGSALQQQIWTHMLESLAKHTTSSGQAKFNKQCLDESLQWSKFFNIFQNAQILSIFYIITHPFRKYS
jgi:anti-anti-sigma factor